MQHTNKKIIDKEEEESRHTNLMWLTKFPTSTVSNDDIPCSPLSRKYNESLSLFSSYETSNYLEITMCVYKSIDMDFINNPLLMKLGFTNRERIWLNTILPKKGIINPKAIKILTISNTELLIDH